MTQPVCVDLYAGLGGWTEGFLAAGYEVVGFDIEQHIYGEHRYPAQLVIQDVLTLHGKQFKDAHCIVASPPCQEFSYMAMPWTRAKEKARQLREDAEDRKRLTALFDACFRIQREACEAAGRHIPLVVENVCGAQKWVGRARWHYGSYYLWGDVPALMPIAMKAPKFILDDMKNGQRRQVEGIYENGVKVATMGSGWYPPDHPKHVPGLGFNTHAERATKNTGGSWFNVAHNTTSGHSRNPVHDGTKGSLHGWSNGKWQPDAEKQGGDWFREPGISALGSKSAARKAASARIAKIPFLLAKYIAETWRQRA